MVLLEVRVPLHCPFQGFDTVLTVDKPDIHIIADGQLMEGEPTEVVFRIEAEFYIDIEQDCGRKAAEFPNEIHTN